MLFSIQLRNEDNNETPDQKEIGKTHVVEGGGSQRNAKKEAVGRHANEGLLIERVELANPRQGHNEKNHGEEQSLLPHERDQTTGREGTSLANEDSGSRAEIGQAAEDTKRGLRDTERRGIPSDITLEAGEADALEKNRNKR